MNRVRLGLLTLVVLSTVVAVALVLSAARSSTPPPVSPSIAGAPSTLPAATEDTGLAGCSQMHRAYETAGDARYFFFVPEPMANDWSGLFASSQLTELQEAGVDWAVAYLGGRDETLAYGKFLLLDQQCAAAGRPILPEMFRP